jgi:hypothetical protein
MLEVWFVAEGSTVTGFVAMLEAHIDGEYREVIRDDGAHGRPHRDTLGWSGRTIRKQRATIGTTNNQALSSAINDITENWERNIEDFLRRKP